MGPPAQAEQSEGEEHPRGFVGGEEGFGMFWYVLVYGGFRKCLSHPGLL